jgi:hypothetical protein
VPGGSSYLGSFDREEAVEHDALDYFASGHPLVEGIFSHLADSTAGWVAGFEIEIGRDRGEGIVAIYKEGAQFEIVALDATGRARPDWAAALKHRPLGARRVTDGLFKGSHWPALVRTLGAQLDSARRPHALAAIVVRPRR